MTDAQLAEMAHEVHSRVCAAGTWGYMHILAALKGVRQASADGLSSDALDLVKELPSTSDQGYAGWWPPIDLSKPYWRCRCGVVAMPLTDDTRCFCSDYYEQEWTRLVPVLDTSVTRYPAETGTE